ncbi:unnamed protein product [Caenorhabditis auriculariae]|uniref:Exonuclease 1 n=1 Tax=Caenorhabditis auriculariae TaxID=2777116 RepID=A0A8S1H5D9_9PELO|nr:unnamed protein product [Caenorhabditis auriculariae]
MGISGLLPFVKNACRQGNIRELRGRSVALDVSCMLHRALFGCMDQIHMGTNTDSYLGYVKRYVDILLELDCHVIMVFDGRPLPAKKDINDGRKIRREENVRKGEILLARGQVKEAREKFRMATKISREVVEKTIECFRKVKNVDIVVAPYEADAQLAYLMMSKLADAVVTEDSDLIVFGCDQIYFKWQHNNGECMVYQKSELSKCFSGEMGGNKFDFLKFRRICILAGCDYLQSGLQGVGLATALKFFSKTSSSDLKRILPKVPLYLNMPKLRGKITPQFVEDFIRAENTFMHQVVFDPRERCQKPLTPYKTSPDSSQNVTSSQTSSESTESFYSLLDSRSPTPEVIQCDEELSELKMSQNSEASSLNSTISSESFHYAGEVVPQRTAIRLALGNTATEPSLNDKFFLLEDENSWSVWSSKFVSRGSIRELKAEEQRIKETKCGAFEVDSAATRKTKTNPAESAAGPKKRKLLDQGKNSMVARFLDDVDEAANKKPDKSLKNEASGDYSAESMIARYGAKSGSPSQPTAKKRPKMEKKSVSRVENAFLDDIEIEEEVKISEIKTKIVEITEEKASVEDFSTENQENLKEEKDEVENIENSEVIPTPEVKNNSSKITPVSSKQSSYFLGRSPNCSNPFRKPVFLKKSETPTEKEPIAEKKRLLGDLDIHSTSSNSEDVEPTPVNAFKVTGFKGAGLRRKSSL